jgi:hypothetical protein
MMVAQTLSTHLEREAPEVLRWRWEQLLDAGYDTQSASYLAKLVEIDLHLAVRLVHDGCPPDTALRILV